MCEHPGAVAALGVYMRLIGVCAGEREGSAARVRVLVRRDFGHAAHAVPFRVVTVLCVRVERDLRQSAGENGLRLPCCLVRCHGFKACIGVLVRVDLRQRTPERAGLVITGLVVRVDNKVGISADKSTFGVIAFGRVAVDAERFRRADSGLRRGIDAGIAGVGMHMLRQRALHFLRERRERESVDGAENDDGGKAGHGAQPESLFPMRFHGFSQFFSHDPSILPDRIYRARHGRFRPKPTRKSKGPF